MSSRAWRRLTSVLVVAAPLGGIAAAQDAPAAPTSRPNIALVLGRPLAEGSLFDEVQ